MNAFIIYNIKKQNALYALPFLLLFITCLVGCGSGNSSPSDNGAVSSNDSVVQSLTIDAAEYSDQSGTQIESDAVSHFDQGDWIRFDNVDFKDGTYNLISLLLAVNNSYAGGELNVRVDSLDGPIIASFYVLGTGGWEVFSSQTTNLISTSGLKTLYIEGIKGNGIANIKTIELHKGEPIDESSVTTLALSPSNPVLIPNTPIEFTVIATDSFGREIDISDLEVNYSANIGVITPEGQYTCSCDPTEDSIRATLNTESESIIAETSVTIHSGIQALKDVVWAENAGGQAYLSLDNVLYYPSTNFSNAEVVNSTQPISATPDPSIYETALVDDAIDFTYSLPNGTYTLHLKMAAINQISSNFSVVAEGITLKSNVNIVAARDGNVNANYDLTFDKIEVTDGELNVLLQGQNSLVSALVITSPEEQKEWELVWSDEFDGETIDLAKWSLESWAPGHVNNELQRYTNRHENARVENGNLVIEARRDFYQGDEYSSARLHTAGKGDLLYGRIEVRAKLPDGRGTWPAIWMMPTNFFEYATTCSASTGWTADCDAWPNSGEIDVMEHVGFDSGQTWATVHNKAYYWVNGQQRKGALWDETLTQEFHVYAIEWSENRIDIYKDDARYFTYINENTGWEAWPYDHPFHLILNLAVGGNWGAVEGVDSSIWPKQLLIDYVRMYKFLEK